MRDEAYHFLLGLKALREEYATRMEELARTRAAATKTTAQLTGMAVSGSKDPHKDSITLALADADERMQVMRERLRAESLLAEELIVKLPNPLHWRLLYLRYVNGLEWKQIVKALADLDGAEVTDRTVYNWHNAALDSAQKIWENGLYDNRYRQIKEGYPLA